LILFILIFCGYCEKFTDPPYPNQPPETTIANIPVENDTLFPIVTLHWNGGDSDGYVAGYEYRYITYNLFLGDSVVSDWKLTNQTSITLTLVSNDSLNKQRFQVRAIDNVGDIDPTPAEKVFYTWKAIPPVTKIVLPTQNDEYFVMDSTTDWWSGIQLIYTASDKDGEISAYAWAVDDSEWTWTQDTSIYITPDKFRSPLAGEHEIKVTSRDNTNIIDPVGSEVKIQLVEPTFEKMMLVIDETDEDNLPSKIEVDDDSVDNFYRSLLENYNRNLWDEWDYKAEGIPPREILGQYQLLFWHADDKPSSFPHAISQHFDILKDYIVMGGDLIVSGWRVLKSFAWQDDFPKTFENDSFVRKYLHIIEADETPFGADFTHAYGVVPFSDVKVDSAKLGGVFPYFGALSQVNIIRKRGPFSDILCSYGTSNNTNFPQYRGYACGLIYYGTSFNVVILGFPIFFIEQDDAKILMEEILQALNY